jgi:hypothetical protein
MVRLSRANTNPIPNAYAHSKMQSPYLCEYHMVQRAGEDPTNESQIKDNASVSTTHSTTERVYPKNYRYKEVTQNSETKNPNLSFKYPIISTNAHKMFNSQRNLVHDVKVKPFIEPAEVKPEIKVEKPSNPIIEYKFVFSDLTYHITCQTFTSEGYCPRGKECPNLHQQPHSRYQDVSAKLFQQLERVLREQTKCGLFQILEVTDKYEKYMPVFKRMAYRHDQHDLFPEF